MDGYYDKIESANFDGDDRMKIFEDFGAELVDVGLDDNYLYFIGWNRPYVYIYICIVPGRVAQSVGHLTRKSGVLGSIPGLATYFRFSFRLFKKGSCQLLAQVCARSTG